MYDLLTCETHAHTTSLLTYTHTSQVGSSVLGLSQFKSHFRVTVRGSKSASGAVCPSMAVVTLRAISSTP